MASLIWISRKSFHSIFGNRLRPPQLQLLPTRQTNMDNFTPFDDWLNFLWPGYDLRPISGKTGKYDYGFLPPALFTQVTSKIIELRQKGLRV